MMSDARKQAFINVIDDIACNISEIAGNDIPKDCFDTETYEMIDIYCFVLDVLIRLMKNESRCKDETERKTSDSENY